MTGPGLLCTSALGLDWTLGQKLLHGPKGPGPGSLPPSCLSEGLWFCLPGSKSLFPPQCPFGLCEEEGIGLKVQGHLPSAKAPETGLCAHCSHAPPLRGPGVAVRPRRAAGHPPLPHGRAFSEAGSHISLHPQLEVGYLQILGSQP